MKNVNDFVAGNTFGRKRGTLKEFMEEYNKINKNIEALKLKKKQYDDLIHSNEINSSDLTFKEKYTIYTMIRNAVLNNKEQTYFGDLYLLKSKFEDLNDDLHEYLSTIEGINTLEKRKS